MLIYLPGARRHAERWPAASVSASSKAVRCARQKKSGKASCSVLREMRCRFRASYCFSEQRDRCMRPVREQVLPDNRAHPPNPFQNGKYISW
jgi:hypothetical protein